MLPTIDFTQQLAQLQAQLQSMTPNQTITPQPTTKENCQYRLPCGLCSKTDTFCGLQNSEVKTDD